MLLPNEQYGDFKASDDDIIIGHYRLICTCGACPEQYEVFDETTKEQVGYLRLRHGHFRADLGQCGGTTVYAGITRGDGVFDDTERMPHLKAAVKALEAAIAASSK